jgi:hypothetical protein
MIGLNHKTKLIFMNLSRAGVIPCRCTIAFALTLIGTSNARAQAVNVYNSFGPGNSYNSGVVWAVSGASTAPGYRGQAEFFVPAVSGYLNNIELALYHVSGSTLSDFYLAQDNGSSAPGTILESWLNVQNTDGIVPIISTSPTLLQAGQEYWVCDEPAAANSYNGWWENPKGYEPGFAYERSEWGWSFISSPAPPSGTFSVYVNAVPEPSIAVLLLVGAGFWGRKRS